MVTGAVRAEGDVAAATKVAEGWAAVYSVPGIGVFQEARAHVVLPEGALLALSRCTFHTGAYLFLLRETQQIGLNIRIFSILALSRCTFHTGAASASLNLIIFSKRDPDNSPEYSEVRHLCANPWKPRSTVLGSI